MPANPCHSGATDSRAVAAFDVRFKTAKAEANVPVPAHLTNGDEALYPDKCATYSKALPQDDYGVVNPAAFTDFRNALNSGSVTQWANVPVGGTRTLNGPQASYAYTLVGTDAQQFGSDPSPANQEPGPVVPAAPAMASPEYGTELTELYWCSLLRDTAFTDYPASPVAQAAAAELTGMAATYAGPTDGTGAVTPRLLFRGNFPGETVGPYLSQLLVTPTNLGAQPISQKVITYLPGIDYMTDLATWQDVQQGIATGLVNQKDPTPRFLHDGRGLAAYTHVDELFQAYFTAYLALNTLGAKPNPGNPYLAWKNQNGFGTFGPPDIASTLSEVAKIALNAVWYQKWLVHLRHRPESGAGIAELTRLNGGSPLDGSLNDNVLNSQAIQQSFSKYGNFLLSQPFPEGSPAHPAYPTGHGTVAGACITVLKFFYDGAFVLPNPQVPTADGTGLTPYTYTDEDGGLMTVNGELNKLAHNVTFAHGLHGGIHWRSDSDWSMILGEAVAISFLQDKAKTYHEKFQVQFARLDGGTATIAN